MHVVPPPLRYDHPAPKHVGKKIQEYRACKQEKRSGNIDKHEEDFSRVQQCDEICNTLHSR